MLGKNDVNVMNTKQKMLIDVCNPRDANGDHNNMLPLPTHWSGQDMYAALCKWDDEGTCTVTLSM